MAKTLELRGADGLPLTTFDFGEVPVGGTSARLDVQLANTGDALSSVKAYIVQASTDDGALRATFGGVTVTGTSESTATPLDVVAPGAALPGQVWFDGAATGQGVAQDTGSLEIVYE